MYRGSANGDAKILRKMVGDIVKPKSEEIATCQIKIPVNVIYTLDNCEIISVNYYFKVYVTIS